MNISNKIELKLFGNDIRPESLRSRDLAEFIADFEDTIVYTLKNQSPEIDQEYAFVSLVDIIEGSAKLRFRPTLELEMLTAYAIVVNALKNGSYEQLGTKSINSLRNIRKFLVRKNCSAEFGYTDENNNESVFISAILSPTTSIEMPKRYIVKGETTIYGKVLRSGGKDPKAQIELDPQNIIYCKANEQQAQELGKFLYKYVRLNGIATWSQEDNSIQDFKINKVDAFNKKSIEGSFNELSNLFGEYFDEIAEPNEYINNLRNDSHLNEQEDCKS